MKSLTRRELLKGVFSKDTAKDLYGTWYKFNSEMEKAQELTGDDAVIDIARRLQQQKSKLSNLLRKEGKS